MAEADSCKSAKASDPDDSGDEMTMIDFLKEEERIEENVKAVLGGSDEHNCTYNLGYVKRQAIYSCLTCIPASTKENEKGGICLGCSFDCHDGHELVEMYTKRNFRCDCGNSRFPNKKCSKIPDKDMVNALNKYGQNFSGTYCACRRPYPDPEARSEEMLQCIMCEDWFHATHIGSEKVADDSYSEMICVGCVNKCDFLRHYFHLTIHAKEDSADEQEHLEKGGVPTCPLNGDKKEAATMYMISKWRERLCRCASCMAMYEKEKVMFLLDSEDEVLVYEEKGLMKNGKRTATQYEKGLEALASLSRHDMIEAVEGYNQMKEQLKDYLKKFVDNKKVVREEDIHEFFSEMNAKKKPRVALPHFCR